MSSAAPFPVILVLSASTACCTAAPVRSLADGPSLPFLPPEASGFLAEISRHFGEYPTNFSLAREFAPVAAAMVALLVAILLTAALRQRRERCTPEGWVNDPRVIRELFDAAILQRGRFEMRFHGPVSRHSTYCTAVAMTRSALTLECSLLRTVPKSWWGRQVDCYFRIRQKRMQVYYQFTSVIAGAQCAPLGDRYAPCGPHAAAGAVWLVNLTMPDKLERRQKRAFQRLDAPRRLVPGFAAWPTAPDTPPPADISRLGAPLLALPPIARPSGVAARGPARVGHGSAPGADPDRLFPNIDHALPVALLNLSGGGLRLLLPRATVRAAAEPGANLEVDGCFVALLELYDPQHDQNLGFWLHCRIQNRFVTFEARDVELGVQILAWGHVRANAPHMADWKPMSEEGEAEPLGNWVIRRQLELYRESGSDVV